MSTTSFFNRAIVYSACLGMLFTVSRLRAADSAQIPTICVSSVDAENMVVVAHIRAGFRSIVLETRADAASGPWSNHVSGAVDGNEGMVVFSAPSPGPNAVYRIRAGQEITPPAATYTGPSNFSVTYGMDSCFFTENERTGHVLNRLAYGPSEYDLQRIASIGLEGWISEQLNPASIDEASNDALNTRLTDLFITFQPADETEFVRSGDVVSYFKGSIEPPAAWNTLGFADAGWLTGPTGLGYGDGDDETELDDMAAIDGVQIGYSTVYLRKSFNVADPSSIDALSLKIDFDDGFVAYLNGTEIARTNFVGTPVNSSLADNNHEAGMQEEIDVSASKNLIQSGVNVLAIVGLNVSTNSSDFTLNPELVGKQFVPGMAAQTRMGGIDELQQLVHLRGVYARRQLQAILGEFWENHFTTDYDKVQDFMDDLENSDATDAMPYGQAEIEAVHAEYTEHEFFFQNALGHFGDMLLFSATSPAQLIYLDNVLNMKGAANENYAREILELYAFGVDNRYTQADIEELARCFTGWTVRKVWPDEVQSFPDSARTPPLDESVQFTDTIILDEGAGWKYLKGLAEPTAVGGLPTTVWAGQTYDDTFWAAGGTPIGYGNVGYGTTGYFETELPDMRQTAQQTGYASVYLRREFTIADPSSLQNPVLAIKGEDGFIAYLNGEEVARSRTMEGTGTPPAFDQTANGNGSEPIQDQNFSLKSYQHLLLPAPQANVLAVQLHNVSLTSSDVAVAPRIVDRALLPGSIENGDFNGLWTFRFNPEEHDIDPKVLFSGTAYQMDIPEGRVGLSGVNDAIDVIDAMESHPSTAEFICVKLVNRFVSDEISLNSYHDRTASDNLLTLMDNALTAWDTDVNGRKGHIGTVMQAIIDPLARVNIFWGEAGFKTKIKSPIEYINSTLRAVGSQIDPDNSLPDWNDDLGMHLFTRDEPDGWSEIGLDWMDSGTLLERVEFSRMVAGNSNGDYQWDTAAWVVANSLSSTSDIVDYFNQNYFQGTLGQKHIDLLVAFGDSTGAGPSVLDPTSASQHGRVRELLGLILSLPHWQYQ